MIDLSKISIVKIDQRLYELDQEINELRRKEDLKKELNKIKDLIVWYDELKRKVDLTTVNEKGQRLKPMSNDQIEHYLDVINSYPALSVYKTMAGTQRFAASYPDGKSLKLYGEEAEKKLVESGYANRLEQMLQNFLKDEAKEESIVLAE